MIDLLKQRILTNLNYDIFLAKENNTFNFVRCMNILNIEYFPEDKIIIGLQNLKDSLVDKGILLIGRTLQNGVNQASFYKKENNNLILMEEINGGSEIKSIIEG